MGFNSKQFEFADIRVSILGASLTGLRGIEYTNKQEKEAVYGAGNEPLSIQRGNKDYSGTLTVLKSDYDAMNTAARAAGYAGIIDVPAKDISLTVVYQGNGSQRLQTDILIGLEFTDASDGMKQGDKFKEIELPFIFLRLKQQ